MRQGSARDDADFAGIARAAQQEVDHRRLVDRRRGVGAREDGGDAASGRGRRRRGDGLAMLGPRLADEGAHVDEAWRDDVAAAIDDARVRGQILRRDLRPEIKDGAVDNEDAAALARKILAVDEAATDEGQGLMRDRRRGRNFQGGSFPGFNRSADVARARRARPCARRRPFRPVRGCGYARRRRPLSRFRRLCS